MIKSLLSVLLLHATSAAAVSLTAARDTYDLNKVGEAEQLYRQIIADPQASADDRAGAGIELARIAWLVDGNADLALQKLNAASAAGGKPCEVSVMMTRVLREAKRSSELFGVEARLLKVCDDPVKRDPTLVNIIAAQLDRAFEAPAERAALLQQVKANEKQLTEDAGVEAARVRLEAALLTNDAPEALTAWKGYFWLEDTDAPQALGGLGVTGLFDRGLAMGPPLADRLALTAMLMRAGFAEQSRRYAATHGLPGEERANPVWRRLQAYWSERDKLQVEVLRVNRALARGAPKDSLSLEEPAKAATAALMSAAGVTGDPREILLKYYGLIGTAGRTSGYPSIHMGHVIEDHDDVITQYGHTAKIHFKAIDNMIANGFESWLWDGSAGVGGWTADGVIIHVRPRYVQSPLLGWRLTKDGAERRELIARQAKLRAEDIVKLEQRPVATLEGLNDRLQLQLVDQIYAGVRSRTPPGGDMRKAFLAEFSKANLNQSIRVHEGRHAIDETLGLFKAAEQPVLEYRAKLSELALTAYPRMALRNMDRNLEGDGPHDKAGANIFDGYRKWMQAHPDQIMGYDPNVPVLEQMDKLTDSQIREIARVLDPLAGGASPPSEAQQAGH